MKIILKKLRSQKLIFTLNTFDLVTQKSPNIKQIYLAFIIILVKVK